jgi:Zn-dependent protease with chaperone function
MILALLAQSILHGLVSALFVEALFRRCRIVDAAWRLRLRALGLVVTAVGPPALILIAPFRESAAFAARWALFAGERWDQVRVGGAGLGDLALLFSAATGSVLFLRDALPPLVDMVRGTVPLREAPPWHAGLAMIRPVVDARAAALGIAPPGTRLVEAPVPILLCEGVHRPVVVVSPATLERLRGDDLDAAITHELAHAAHHDPAWSYVLIAVRAALFFNPAVQWLARAMVDDIECRADQTAARATGGAAALIRAIHALFEADHPPPSDGDASFERVFWRIRKRGVERRCECLGRTERTAPMVHGPILLASAAAALATLIFFVV